MSKQRSLYSYTSYWSKLFFSIIDSLRWIYVDVKKRYFLIMRYYEKRLRNFHSKMYGYVNRSVFIWKWKFQVSSLSGFKVIIQNVHVQFPLCNSIYSQDTVHVLHDTSMSIYIIKPSASYYRSANNSCCKTINFRVVPYYRDFHHFYGFPWKSLTI